MSHCPATEGLTRYFERSAKALNEAIPYNSAPVMLNLAQTPKWCECGGVKSQAR
jgi:hypothetical protein